MAKKSSENAAKSLVIVESPAKARTIAKFLGRQYTVEASIGHVRDLPESARDIPAEYKAHAWARLGVNVEEGFEPIYVVPPKKKAQVTKLRQALKGARELFLATDEDREGEAISWHLCQLLKPKVPVRRLVFHEITEEAILDALKSPRDIDTGLVQAQEARRILDRLYGYEVSPLLWKKVRPKLSAGRVQSVAVRLIVQRERQRCEFVRASFWDLLGTFATEAGESFQAILVSVEGRRIPAGRDFDPATGKLKDPAMLLLDEPAAGALAQRLRGAEFRITGLEVKPFTSRPAPPFITSTLQQEANRKLGFTARRTMSVAQSLYENGYITYMRTDSTNLAQVAVDAARDLIVAQYGREYLPESPRSYRATVKNAQEAHEAIRPAGHPFALPESLRGALDADQHKLFELIWKRTIASQMADARGKRLVITVEGGGAVFQVTGKTIDFAGFLRAYVEGSDDPQAELADKEVLLPAVERGDRVACRDLESKSHQTQPPARYSEASLTRALEEMGIGRPSTYASIIDTILAREYVFKRGGALVPTWVAFAVVRLMEDYLPGLVDYQFTAQMEDFLDAISRHEAEHVRYLHDFYYGNGMPGLKTKVESSLKDIDPREISRIPIGQPTEGEHREPIFVRVGRFGPFLEQGSRTASLSEDLAPDEVTVEVALEMLERGKPEAEPLGVCPETQRPVFLKQGRFGPYVQLGDGEGSEKPKNASLLKGMEPSQVDLETALKLLSLPRDVGPHPESAEPVLACNGKFGPYVKCGSESRSLPAGVSPLEVTLKEALDLLAQPKTHGRRAAAPREPLKVFEASPLTGEPVKLLDGRYGPYVTDGQTNASLPRGSNPGELTFPQALSLLAERAAKGPSTKKRSTRRSSRSTERTKATTGASAKRSGRTPRRATGT